jgi:hypothetical protein
LRVEDEAGKFIRQLNAAEVRMVHAPGGATPNSQSGKQVVEKFWGREWASSREVQNRFGPFIGFYEPETISEPPDFWVQFEQRLISVEHCQLIDKAAINQARKLVEDGLTIDQARSSLFEQTQWPQERIVEKLGQLITCKHNRYANRGQSVDVLLISSSEPWLLPDIAEGAIKKLQLDKKEVFRFIYLILEYDPAWHGYPVFELP